MEQEQESLREVKLVVDANILFSAVLKNDGVVAETFRAVSDLGTLIAPAYIADELIRLRPKMARAAGRTTDEVERLQRWTLSQVKLIAEDVISQKHWIKAVELVGNVDENDTPYVALALAYRCPIWTGDKKLVTGLRKKGFELVMTTEELRKKLA